MTEPGRTEGAPRPAVASLALRLKAAGARIARELVRDLAPVPEGRALLEQHVAGLRDKGDDAGALVGASALALLDSLTGAGAPGPTVGLRNVPRSLEEAVRSGKLVESRRQTAFAALRERGDTWARSLSRGFADGLERAQAKESKGVEALVAEESITREAPKVGRNDPCPCGSGKKFKKCCEKAPKDEDASKPSLARLLGTVRWVEELYALDPDQQRTLVGDELFREHLALLAQAERPRKAPREDPYLDLAVLSRVLQSRAAPSWARDLGLSILARGHAAVDRGGLAGWLVESYPGEVASALQRLTGPFTAQGAVALGLALVDAKEPAAALEAVKDAGADPRAAFVRALAAERKGDEALARTALDALVAALDGPDDALLRAGAAEARAALDDRETEAVASPAASEGAVASGGALDAEDGEDDADLAAEDGAAATEPLVALPRVSAAVDAEPPEPVVGPRAAALVDAELPREVQELATKRARDREAVEAELVRSRREHDEAKAALRALERDLEKARERADRAKRSVTRGEHDLEKRDKDGPRDELSAIARVLRDGHERIKDALHVWKKGAEVPVPVVAALGPDSMLFAVPIPVREYLDGTLDGPLALMAHAAIAHVATVARQAEQGEETVLPASLEGYLGIRGHAPLARYRDRSELWALALDEAWATLDLPGQPRLAPVVAPLPEATTRSVLELARPLDLPPPPRVKTDKHGLLSVEEAAAKLGLSTFALARALGARALWDSSGSVLEGTLETLRVLDHLEPRHDPAADSHDDHELAADDPIMADPEPARRALRIVLRRLIRFGKIGASHTRVDNALRGAPPHLRGAIKDAVDALVTLGVFRAKPTLNGLHISIEPVRLRECDTFIASGESPWPRVTTILEGA